MRHSSGEKHKADDAGDAGSEAALAKRKKLASPGGPAAAEGEKESAEEKMDEEKQGAAASGEDGVESRGIWLDPFVWFGSQLKIHILLWSISQILFNHFVPPQESRDIFTLVLGFSLS